MIESIDTNILVRLIIGDIPDSYKKIRKLLAAPDKTFFIANAALIELEHVLDKIYKYPRSRITIELGFIINTANILIESDIIKTILPFYESHPSLSFVDCYLAEKSNRKKAEPLWTLDHKFAAQSQAAKLL
jgi:predicted nucleic-acid-binding protein